MRFMSTNVGSKKVGEKMTIYGMCVETEWPEILEKIADGTTKLGVCPEETHMNLIGYKAIDFVRMKKLEEVRIVTCDGSPHCVQLHYVGEELRRLFGIEVRHYVIEKGKVYEVSPKAVRTSRYLSKIEKLLSKSSNE